MLRKMLFFTLFPFILLAQKSKEQKEIDSLIKVYNQSDINTNYKKTIKGAKILILKSEKDGNEKGLAIGNALIGYSLSKVGKYKESIYYINKSNQYSDYLKKDANQRHINFLFLAFNYQQLGLYSFAFEEYFKTLRSIDNKKNTKNSNILTQRHVYINIANLYNVTKQYDSAYHYYKKNMEMNQINHYADKAYQINGIGYYHLHKKNSDSAIYYYQKSVDYFEEEEKHSTKADALTGLAQAYSNEDNFPKAINYSLKAIKIYEDLDVINTEIDIYKSVSDYYNKTGNYKLGKVYIEKYLHKKDSIDLDTKKGADFVVNEVISLERTQQENIRKKNLKITGTITGLLSFLLMIILYFNKKSKHKNIEKISQVNKLLQKKEEETHQLKQKVNESFEEVVQLAKENNSEFLTRFQEVYPDFIENLLEIKPNLISSELRFCAMLFLNFTTKDIAKYTFTSPKTVQNRKNSIRKKFNIPSNEDLYLWFNNL